MSKRAWTYWVIALVLAAGLWVVWWYFTPSLPAEIEKAHQAPATQELLHDWAPLGVLALYGSALAGWVLVVRFVVRSFRSGFGLARSYLLAAGAACLVGAMVMATRLGGDADLWWQAMLLDMKLVVGVAALVAAMVVYALRLARAWPGPKGAGPRTRSATVWGVILFVLFTAALAGADLEFRLSNGPEFLHEVPSGYSRSMNHMDSIVGACNRYSDEHDGQYPPSLAVLVKEGYIPEDALVNPRWPRKSVGYVYIRPLVPPSSMDIWLQPAVLYEAYDRWPREGVLAFYPWGACKTAATESALLGMLHSNMEVEVIPAYVEQPSAKTAEEQSPGVFR